MIISRSQGLVALGLCTLFSSLTISNFSFAAGDEMEMAHLTTETPAVDAPSLAPEPDPAHENEAAETENYVKVVFLNGLSHSWWAPGLTKANDEICKSIKTQYSKNGQGWAIWTWGETKDVPRRLYDAGVVAIDHFKKAANRPTEIWGKEFSEAYHESILTAMEDARGQTDPVQQRLTLLSGKTKGCLKAAGKAVFEAPVVGFYHTSAGILAVPFQGAWSIFRIGYGACGTVFTNVVYPLVSGLRWGQAVTCSAIAAAGVGVANTCLPDMPVAPANPNDHQILSSVSADEGTSTLTHQISDGEEH